MAGAHIAGARHANRRSKSLERVCLRRTLPAQRLQGGPTCANLPRCQTSRPGEGSGGHRLLCKGGILEVAERDGAALVPVLVPIVKEQGQAGRAEEAGE